MPPVGFEPTISAGERPQIYALDRAATGTCEEGNTARKFWKDGEWRVFVLLSSYNPGIPSKSPRKWLQILLTVGTLS